MSVSSAPEKGSTFTIHLPCVDAPLETEREIVQPTVRSGVETILLVEDDPQVRTLAKAVLVRKGYIVIDASDAEDALRLAAQQTGPLDLLLTDVMMPGMNGRLLVEKMSERYPGLRVLYMSGYTDDAIVQYGVVTSGVAFLQKPFTPAALARAVREVLDQGTSGGGSFTKNQ